MTKLVHVQDPDLEPYHSCDEEFPSDGESESEPEYLDPDFEMNADIGLEPSFGSARSEFHMW